ncbi:vegetative cell wall protein gp1-like isoform X2 [Gambusia affinis]|uniref:vegetative cell wall protein gp1-like isoform X2 n=1 Tax=Gambusia affinis TaxID=33528 RepID=UPI001CDC4220|nr:vegetative cell wall protein gp1-like isoform X2 [Gambusia affinis]
MSLLSDSQEYNAIFSKPTAEELDGFVLTQSNYDFKENLIISEDGKSSRPRSRLSLSRTKKARSLNPADQTDTPSNAKPEAPNSIRLNSATVLPAAAGEEEEKEGDDPDATFIEPVSSSAPAGPDDASLAPVTSNPPGYKAPPPVIIISDSEDEFQDDKRAIRPAVAKKPAPVSSSAPKKKQPAASRAPVTSNPPGYKPAPPLRIISDSEDEFQDDKRAIRPGLATLQAVPPPSPPAARAPSSPSGHRRPAVSAPSSPPAARAPSSPSGHRPPAVSAPSSPPAVSAPSSPPAVSAPSSPPAARAPSSPSAHRPPAVRARPDFPLPPAAKARPRAVYPPPAAKARPWVVFPPPPPPPPAARLRPSPTASRPPATKARPSPATRPVRPWGPLNTPAALAQRNSELHPRRRRRGLNVPALRDRDRCALADELITEALLFMNRIPARGQVLIRSGSGRRIPRRHLDRINKARATTLLEASQILIRLFPTMLR